MKSRGTGWKVVLIAIAIIIAVALKMCIRDRFKSKKTHRYSYKSKCVNGNIQYCNKYIKLPKLGMVKTKNKLIPQGRILNATVSQEPSGKYFVSLCCTDVDIKTIRKDWKFNWD